jgi:hypothetical protein
MCIQVIVAFYPSKPSGIKCGDILQNPLCNFENATITAGLL